MQYMILLYSDHSQAPDFEPGTPEFDAMMAEWMDYTKSLIDAGQYVGGEALTDPSTATTLRKSFDGTESVTDGPFAETKEQLGGYYIVECNNLDEALDCARRVPIPVGSLEVRPVMPTPTPE